MLINRSISTAWTHKATDGWCLSGGQVSLEATAPSGVISALRVILYLVCRCSTIYPMTDMSHQGYSSLVLSHLTLFHTGHKNSVGGEMGVARRKRTAPHWSRIGRSPPSISECCHLIEQRRDGVGFHSTAFEVTRSLGVLSLVHAHAPPPPFFI